jgi:hypothetical protein
VKKGQLDFKTHGRIGRHYADLKYRLTRLSMSIIKTSRLQLLNEFELAPDSALFNQQTIAAVLSCSTQLLERNRWAGTSVPYLKIGRKVLYRKSDVIDFLQQQKRYRSTSEESQSIRQANN